MKKRILITGSSGMLGIDLWQELDRDYEVYGLDRIQNTEYRIQRFCKADITKKRDVIEAIAGTKPDIVIHAAAWTDVDGCERDKDKAYKVNSEGTRNVALGCKETGAVLVYMSTDFVFDGRKRRPYKETDRTNSLSVYGDSKLKGEEAVKKILERYFILRTSWLYGKNGRNFVDTILKKAKTKKVLKVVDDQVGSPTYTKDLAKAIHKLLNVFFTSDERLATSDGIYHVSNTGSVSWYEYAKEILRLAGLKTKVIPISSKELARPAKRPAMSVLDNTKFARFTGHKMRPWKKALEEYLG
jgi:dTDP-4-dehydrorhamnose reductase